MHCFFDVGGPMRSVVNGPVRGTSGDLDMRSSMALPVWHGEFQLQCLRGRFPIRRTPGLRVC